MFLHAWVKIFQGHDHFGDESRGRQEVSFDKISCDRSNSATNNMKSSKLLRPSDKMTGARRMLLLPKIIHTLHTAPLKHGKILIEIF